MFEYISKYPSSRVPYWGNRHKYLVPCYNIQNGYYSDELDIIVTVDGVTHTFNVREFTEDNIS